MPIETGAAGSVQQVQRPQSTDNTKLIHRREGGEPESPFSPRTDVDVKNSVRGMAQILSKISTSESDTLTNMPKTMQKVIQQVLESAFSLSETLAKGAGSTMESQRFSMEQLVSFARMLNQMGNMVDKGRMTTDFDPSIEKMLQNFKSMLTAGDEGGALQNAMLNKASFQLIDAKETSDMPVMLRSLLAQLGNGQKDNVTEVLRQLLDNLMPKPQSAVEMGLSKLRYEGANGRLNTSQPGAGMANAALRAPAGQAASIPGQPQTANASAGVMQDVSQQATMNDASRMNGARSDFQQGSASESAPATEGTPQATSPRTNVAASASQQEVTQQAPTTTQNAEGVPEAASRAETAVQNGGNTSSQTSQPAQNNTSGTGETAAQPGARQEAVQETAAQQGAHQEALQGQRPQAGQQPAANEASTARSAQTLNGHISENPSARATEQVSTMQGRQEMAGSRTSSTSAPSNAQQMAQTSGQDARPAAPSAMSFIFQRAENTPQLMQSMKDLGTLLLRDNTLTQQDSALLQNFINQDQPILSEKDAKQLNQLLRIVENNVPAAVRQAARMQNLPDLPRLWAFMQLCDLTTAKDMKGKQLRKAGRDISVFAASMKESMEGTSLSRMDQDGTLNRSVNFMFPLYMENGQKSYPAYINIYDEEPPHEPGKPDQKETWLRVCVLTDNIGAVDLTCCVYDRNQLSVRLWFSDEDAMHDFSQQYMQDFRQYCNGETSFELSNLRVGLAGDVL